MKTLISMVLGIMIPFIMTDNDDPSLLERISWIPETTLYPYCGSKILDTNQYRFVNSVGFNPEDYGDLPIYTWDDVQGTIYTASADELAIMYRKFIPQNKNYIVMSTTDYDANAPEADKTGLTKVTFTKIVTENVTTETTGTKSSLSVSALDASAPTVGGISSAASLAASTTTSAAS